MVLPSFSVRWLLAMALTSSIATTGFAATERLRRAIHELPGVPAGAADVAQDSDGSIWIAGDEGLARFDGIDARRLSPEVITEYLEYVSVGPDGAVCAGNPRGGLYEVVGDRARVVAGADGRPLRFVRHAVYDAAAGLWAIVDGELVHRTAGADLSRVPVALDGETPWRLGADSHDAAVIVGTIEGSLWRLRDGRSDAVAVTRGLGGRVNRIVVENDDALVVTVRDVGVVRVRDGRARLLAGEPSRPTGLASRGGAVWAAFTDAIWSIRDGEPPRRLDEDDGFPGSGSVLVDRDGGLWLTSFRGVELLPEPQTVIWTTTAGGERIRSTSVQPTARGGVWVATWDGPVFRREGEEAWRRLATGSWWTADDGCLDGDGRVWASAWSRDEPPRTALLRWDAGEPAVLAERAGAIQLVCDRDERGTTWMVYGRELFALDRGADVPIAAGTIPVRDVRLAGFAVDPVLGAAAVAADELCTAAAPDGPWTCAGVPGVGALLDVDAGPDGRWWVATSASRVVALAAGRWVPVLPERAVRNTRVFSLTPSPRGGLWVSTGIEKVRVDRLGEAIGVVERLSGWNGVPAWWSGAVRELDDGSLWLPTSAGPLRVPPGARRDARSAPDLSLTALTVDGRRRAPATSIELPAGKRHLEARFASFAYRDLGDLRYRVRVAGGAWSPAIEPVLRVLRPSAGKHRLEIEASVDGLTWSDAPAAFVFRIAPPWYLTPPAGGLGALLVGLLAFAAHRLRVLHLLRLERQRAAIAMDLHDEVGAAVGGIGMMAGVIADPTSTPDQRSAVARRIVDAAADLGATLYDIIGSLRDRDGRAATLADHLTERGARLFPGDGASFEAFVGNNLAGEALTLPVRRNVQRILIEAMHNAARHADATHVTLGFDRDEDGFVGWVEDDGVGLPGTADRDDASTRRAGDHAGLGLEGMHARAAEIGAHLAIGPGRAGGIRIELRFRADGKLWRPHRPSRARTRGLPGRAAADEAP